MMDAHPGALGQRLVLRVGWSCSYPNLEFLHMGFLLQGALSVLPVRNFALGFLEAEATAEVLRMSLKGPG